MSDHLLINQWRLNKKTSELICQTSQHTITLEPQQCALLLFFINHHNVIVSRQQIAEQVWPNVVVEDNTISKAVTRLRKVLDDNTKNPTFIRTVPKQGYLFIADITPTNDTPAHTINVKPVTATQKHFLTYTALLIGIVTIIIWYLQPKQIPVSYHSEAVTFESGREYNASGNHDFSIISYLATDNLATNLFLKRNNQASLIAQVNASQTMPKLNNSGNMIAYSDIDATGLCHIFLVDVSRHQSSRNAIADCDNAHTIQLQWHSVNNDLYWVANQQLHRFDSHKKTTEIMFSLTDMSFVQPLEKSDTFAVLTNQSNQSNILIVDKHGNTIKQLNIAHAISRFVVDSDELSFYYIGEHPSTSVLRHSLSNTIDTIVNLPFGYVEQVSDINKNNELLLAISYIDLDIVEQKDHVITKRVNSSYPDYNARVSHDNSWLAYASKRSGNAQLWLQDQQGNTRQISDFEQTSYLYEHHWSADNSHILLKRNNQLWLFDVIDNQQTQLTLQIEGFNQFGWLSDNQLFFIDASSRELTSYNLMTKQQSLLKNNAKAATFNGHTWYIEFTDKAGIWQADKTFTQVNLQHQLPAKTLLWQSHHNDLSLIHI